MSETMQIVVDDVEVTVKCKVEVTPSGRQVYKPTIDTTNLIEVTKVSDILPHFITK
ncbi:hypothetical protein [Providencia hangzhouensis]|uniref:hypothetical protein n=1 Tax=Providencia hangzhouensis TaxID=3031799 RepID=UPI0024AA475B|nr:hypothetical protein [Providencia rettgeri]